MLLRLCALLIKRAVWVRVRQMYENEQHSHIYKIQNCVGLLTLRVYTSVRIVKIIVYDIFIFLSFFAAQFLYFSLIPSPSFPFCTFLLMDVVVCWCYVWFHNFAYMTTLVNVWRCLCEWCFKCNSCWNSSNKENSNVFTSVFCTPSMSSNRIECDLQWNFDHIHLILSI